ncbi:hypothetical protein LAZ67_X002364 [Cordylochernes scorpioides]|uniref:Exophilin 5 n=1 Tax=Cordylochernes scorpioides TaxID=51811 RepID=A0ABY6LTC2_9ARAC|nr:hypothetical protein LAZ67_X002364 [Cordylochernes scorpioides]
MGACYSRKANKSYLSSSSADHPRMATVKNEETLSRTRPTPYSRNIPQPNPAISKKITFIPKPTETLPMDGKHHGRSSSIPRPTGPKIASTIASSEELDTNSNHSNLLSESHYLANNNIQNLVTSSKAKNASTLSKGQTSFSKIPSKLTANLSGLPRPQVAHIVQKNIATNDSEIKFRSNHDPSPDGEEWDSGLGSSLAEKQLNKSEDAETLKDADISLESSPIVSSNDMVRKHILKFENISLPSNCDDITKKKNANISKTSFHNPSTSSYRGVLNYSESFKKTFVDYGKNSPPPITYGSYKNFLMFKKNISPVSSSNYAYSAGNKKEIKELKNGKPSKLPGSFNSGNNKNTFSENKMIEGGISLPAQEQPKMKSSQSQQQENGDNSSLTTLSPVAELENRQFLIDDEISDQPGLISFQQQKLEKQSSKQPNSLKESVNELQELKASSSVSPQSAGASIISSCSSLCSDDLNLEYGENTNLRSVKPRPRSLGCETPRVRSTSMPLRPPRQMSVHEQDDGCVRIDASSYRLLCQDLNSVKTMLHRLKSIIYDVSML